MTVYRIAQPLVFPRVEEAEPNGLLGVGGDLSPERLLLAYASGIFPWYEDGGPILWFSPDPRGVLDPGGLHVSSSLAKMLRRGGFEVRMDTAFDRVVRACAWKKRQGQDGTWITEDMMQAYGRLHRLGVAHSVEVWRGDQLLGGLYGVSLGGAFFGESMFSNEANASKIALVWLGRQLESWKFRLIDCQFLTPHLESLGAHEVDRAQFLDHLRAALCRPSRTGHWTFDGDWSRPVTQ